MLLYCEIDIISQPKRRQYTSINIYTWITYSMQLKRTIKSKGYIIVQIHPASFKLWKEGYTDYQKLGNTNTCEKKFAPLDVAILFLSERQSLQLGSAPFFNESFPAEMSVADQLHSPKGVSRKRCPLLLCSSGLSEFPNSDVNSTRDFLIHSSERRCSYKSQSRDLFGREESRVWLLLQGWKGAAANWRSIWLI